MKKKIKLEDLTLAAYHVSLQRYEKYVIKAGLDIRPDHGAASEIILLSGFCNDTNSVDCPQYSDNLHVDTCGQNTAITHSPPCIDVPNYEATGAPPCINDGPPPPVDPPVQAGPAADRWWRWRH
mgnify:CR=1 FL=1